MRSGSEEGQPGHPQPEGPDLPSSSPEMLLSLGQDVITSAGLEQNKNPEVENLSKPNVPFPGYAAPKI